MAKANGNKDDHKYLTLGLSFGLLLGAVVGVVTKGNIGMSGGLGMLLGIVIGTTLDYEIKRKKSN